MICCFAYARVATTYVQFLLCAICNVTFSKTFLAIDLFTFKNRVTRLEMKIPFFFGPLHTTASSRLFNKKPMDMTASR